MEATQSRRKPKAEEPEDDDMPDDDETHVDAVDTCNDVDAWENLVESIETIERGPDGGLKVYMTL